MIRVNIPLLLITKISVEMTRALTGSPIQRLQTAMEGRDIPISSATKKLDIIL